MIAKLKNYLIAAAVVFLIAAVVAANYYYSKYVFEKAEKERLRENQEQLLAENTDYKLIKQSLDEFKTTMSVKVDSILTAEKIRPKRVERIIERHYVYRDTSYQAQAPEPVVAGRDTIYPFVDIKDCFTVTGFLQVKALQPLVTITARLFENSSTDIAYIEREKKFLWWRIGKWKGRLKTINTCGETTTKEIEIVK